MDSEGHNRSTSLHLHPGMRRCLALAAVGLAGVAAGFAAGFYFKPAPVPPPPAAAVKPVPAATYIPLAYADLPGWQDDHVAEAMPALLASCRALAQKSPSDEIGIGSVKRSAAAWQRACSSLVAGATDADLRRQLEQVFTPYAVLTAAPAGDTPEGLFTGYYEADLHGSLTREGPFQVPIYGVPNDLVTIDTAQFIPDLGPTIPRQLVGHVSATPAGAVLTPYYTRQQIDRDHALDGKADVLVWADDPVAVHILHIQGSGRVALPDGREIHVGFAGHNGQAFRGIGSILRTAGVLKPGQASMDHVRDWLRAHPDDAARYMDENARYIFFRITGDSARPGPQDQAPQDPGPQGALGVPLTAGRSLAVDPTFLPLGAPVWLETADPDGVPIRRLVSAQDVGAAITGPVRGDLFWGHGEAAFAAAARMQSKGRYFILIPAE